jgi:hypothetical protein
MAKQQPRGAKGTVGHPYSALNLRLVLATFGLVVCVGFGVLVLIAGFPVPAIILFVLGAVAVVDLIVISRRRAARRREEPPGTHHSLFE